MQYTLLDSHTGEQLPTTYSKHLSPNGNLLNLHMEATFSPADVCKHTTGMWRYRKVIPVQAPEVSFAEGFTPLLALNMWGNKVWVKQEQLFPSGSYKDRGATVLISHARAMGIKHVVQDSSGNAGCAIAAYAAMAGIACDIYLQADTSPGKIAQMQMYGARIMKINGSREDAASAALQAAEQYYYASHCYNPFFFQGTKTFAYEVCEQLQWQAPDAVVLPAGNGTLIIGCYIGFVELAQLGVIAKVPKIIAVQAVNCSPLAQAFAKQSEAYAPVSTHSTLAEGIAIAAPVRGNQMLQMVKDTQGMFVSVSENEILDAWKYCGQQGFYIEPTSAATIAGMKKYMEQHSSEQVVSLFSGHGLKSTEKVLKTVGT
jgi:threonine synthase